MAKDATFSRTLLARLATPEERKYLTDNKIDVILTEPLDFSAYVTVDILPLPQDMEEGTFYITPDGKASFITDDKVVTLLPEDIINDKISHLISVKIVEELPATGDEHTLYLVPLEDEEENDYFDEYIYENGKFEKIGNTRIDLSNYYTKAETNELLREATEDILVERSTAPSTSTVGTVGQLLRDTTTGKIYLLTEILEDSGEPEVYVWKELSTSHTLTDNEYNAYWSNPNPLQQLLTTISTGAGV